MRNRVTNVFQESTAGAKPGGRLWDVDRHPARRLGWLFVLMALPLAAVAVRLVALQVVLADRFLVEDNQTTESFEPIPSRDGRILGADGRLLAQDVEQFQVRMHYRWLQEPADERWLEQQASSHLSPPERRDPRQVTAETRNVLAARRAMWHRLARLTGTSLETLAEQRARIQRQVERVRDHVERRRQQNDPDANGAANIKQSLNAEAPWWQRVWQTVVITLTTPPKRPRPEPLVLYEELDYHPVIDNVPLEAAAEIEAHPELYPGLQIRVSTQRVYPQGSLAAHVIGSRTTITAEQLADRRKQFPHGDPLDYRPGDRIGKTGVERAYNQRLRGLRGLRRVVKNQQGEIIRTEVVRKPQQGQDVELTLHLELQQQMETLLDNVLAEHWKAATSGRASSSSKSGNAGRNSAGGCLVAVDVHSGAVLTAVSAPGYDLNVFVHRDPDLWKQLMDDPRQPFFNRLTHMTLPPGSVFKTLTATALLQDGRIAPDAVVYCQGYLDRPDRYRCYIYRHYGVGHGDTDLSDAICRSCNVYFFTAARRMGPRPIVDWARRFGFGRPTGIDLPAERPGHLPMPGNRQASRTLGVSGTLGGAQSQWYPGTTLQLAIGQASLTVTPLQIARMMAAIANDGYLVTPHVARPAGPKLLGSGVPDTESVRVSDSPPQHRISGLSEDTLRRLREGLERVVADPHGTGYKTVRLKDVAIAGKTGTAEVGDGQGDHAWFAGYVPADHPRIAFAVVLEHAGSGGHAAGPVAQQLVQSLLALGLVRPD